MPEGPEKAHERGQRPEEEKKIAIPRQRPLGFEREERWTREYFLRDLRRVTKRLGGGRFRGGS
jgi:hypothetical protein